MSKADLVPRGPGVRVPVDAPIARRSRARPPDLSGLPGLRRARGREFGEFLSAVEAVIETPPPRWRTASGYVLCALLSAFLCWAMLGSLAMFAVAPGEVVTEAGTQAVEPRVAGAITAILVKDGDAVARGTPLVQLDPTAAIADRAIVRNAIEDLRAEIERRKTAVAAAGKDPVAVDAVVDWAPAISAAVRAREDAALRAGLVQLAAELANLRAQRDAKTAARDRFKADVAAENALIEARTERTAMHQQLADKGWESRAQVLTALEPLRQEQVSLATLVGSLAEAEAGIAVLDREIAAAKQGFVTSNTDGIAAAQRSLDAQEQQLLRADKAVADTTLGAPIAGTVHALAATSVGQSVKPGQQILQVVPRGGETQIVAYVLNTDVGFVRVGQPATIKVDSFPYTRYGTITGRVVKVAPDAVSGSLALAQQQNGASPTTHGQLSVTNSVQQTSDLVFPVVIKPDRDWIAVGDRRVALLSGMSLAVEIETERQRAIAYLLHPLIRGVQ